MAVMSDESRRGLILLILAAAAVRAGVTVRLAALWHAVTTRPPGHLSRRERRQARGEREIWGPYQDTVGQLPYNLPAFTFSPPLTPLPEHDEAAWDDDPVTTVPPFVFDELVASLDDTMTPLPGRDEAIRHYAGQAHVNIGLRDPYDTSPARSSAAARSPYDSGLIPAVRDEIGPSRTLYLHDRFDIILMQARAELAIISHRYAYDKAAA
jgi:hypothetical protein